MSDYDHFDFSKEINLKVDTDIKFDVDIKLEKNVKVNSEINSKVNVEGNAAILVADVEAIGKDTFVEVFTSVLVVEDKLSSVTLEAMAAVA